MLVEPIQCEGGVRIASARFMRKLRLLTRIYDVPLIFDEVQTGWGMTGRMWAHELFDLPLCPPDVVTWAKKAQNGVLFVSEELATFFQEEKKFNTTWEGDSVGMVRVLAVLDKLDLEQVRQTGERARAGLEALAKQYRQILKNVRGAGVMLGFDVMRTDWRDALRDRAFRRGLLLLPAGERVLRFYPRYDTEPAAIDEALSILRLAIEDLLGGRATPDATKLETRVGTLAIPIDTVEIVDITAAAFEPLKLQAYAVEQERYDTFLRLPLETLEATAASPRAIGIALRDRVSGRFVGYALGSALENHDEEGVVSDPHLGENNTFYLHAMAILPTMQNAVELENHLLESLRERALAEGSSSTPCQHSSKIGCERQVHHGYALRPSCCGSTTTSAAGAASSIFRRRSLPLDRQGDPLPPFRPPLRVGRCKRLSLCRNAGQRPISTGFQTRLKPNSSKSLTLAVANAVTPRRKTERVRRAS